MLSNQNFNNRNGVAKRLFQHSFVNFDRGFIHAFAGGLLLGAVALAPTQALAGPPVTIDVTVTDAGGAPVSDASVIVTQTGVQPVDPLAVTGGGKTGANGTASIGTGSTAPTHTSQPLPAGVYQVDVLSGGVHTTTYVYVPEGQTGTPNVDLSTATTMNTQGQTDREAAEAAEAARQAGDQAAYDAAVARVDEIIEFRRQANEELARAVEEFRRANNIPANNLYQIGKLLKRHIEALERGFGDPDQGPVLEQYQDLLQLLESWKRVLGIMETARDDIPSFSYYRSAELDEGEEYADLGLPWLDDEGGAQYANLDRTAENLTSDIATNQGKTIPLHFNLSFHHHY